MDKIKDILSYYKPSDAALFKSTVDMLCKKGVAEGCYQDYEVLCDILEILSACEAIIIGGAV